MSMSGKDGREVLVGRIAGVYGVKGWVRVESFTDPKEDILDYQPWRLRTDSDALIIEVSEGRLHGKGLVARLGDIDDRSAAAELSGMDIFVERAQFPDIESDQYYWADLVGLEVRTPDGTMLGTVHSMIETGSNDVLVVCGNARRLIPFIDGEIVHSVDLEAGTIVVDWDPSF